MAVNLLDVGYYREANPDLAAAGLTDEQLVNHFFTFGINENRLFSRFVDLNFYRASNSDLASLDAPSLYTHLSNFGVLEGRRFSPFFELSFYRSTNPDLGGFSDEQLFNHFQNFGVNEERRASSLVDLGFYRSANPDLAGFNNARLLDHLRRNGITEERRFSPVIDLGIYEAANPDLKAANLSYTGLLQHLGTNGIFEGRRLSLSYDPIFYVNPQNNPDLTGLSSQQLLVHFELFGINDGRQASDYFNVNSYRAANSDLGLNGITTNQQALAHFEALGFREERSPGSTPFAILTGVEPGNDNNNLLTAANLGILNSKRSGTIGQRIDSSDLSGGFLTDIYRFLLPTTSNVSIGISGASRELNLQLVYDRNGDNVNQGGPTNEEIFSRPSTDIPFNRTLGAGTYYVRVFTANQTTNTGYNLTFSAVTVPSIPSFPDPGETTTTALNIGTLSSSNVLLQNFIGVVDPSDIYRFNIAASSNLSLAIDNVSTIGVDGVTLELSFDSNNNNQIDSGETVKAQSRINAPFSFTQPLVAGTYFLNLKQTFAPAGNSSYRLNLSATPT